jgi:hypothetical protein
MKKSITCLLTLILSGMLFLNGLAQEQEGQLWLAGIEVVKSEMIDQYIDLNKEMVALCEAENFPYTFYIWKYGDFKYYLWYPIQSYDDLPKIEKAWDGIVAKLGADKWDKFQECVEYSYEKIMRYRPDLSVMPQNPVTDEGENMYCWWQEFYVKKGHEKAVEAIIQQGNKYLSKCDYRIFMGDGKTGFEHPVLIIWSFGKDKNDYWIRDKAAWEKLDEPSQNEFKKIDQELETHMRKITGVDCWYMKDISYEKAE